MQERPIPLAEPMAVILKRRRRHRRIAKPRMCFEVGRTPSLNIVARSFEAIVIPALRDLRKLGGRWGSRIDNDGPVCASGYAERQQKQDSEKCFLHRETSWVLIGCRLASATLFF
jgi:hypothetical protein